VRRLSLAPWVLLVIWLGPAYGLAQSGGAVEIRQFQPSPFSDRELRLDGTAVLPAWDLQVGLDADYAWKPLVLTDVAPSLQRSRKTTYDFIDQAVGSDLTIALGLGHRLEVAALLPLTAFQTGEATPGAASPGAFGIENPKLGAKVHLLGDGQRGFGLGAALLVALPLGTGGTFIHESGFGGEARLFADHRTARWTVGASAGLRLRDSTQVYDVKLGDELLYAAGATIRLSERSELLAELAGSTAAGRPFGAAATTPVEALFGGRRRLGGLGRGNLWLTGAAGPGLVAGYGSPLLRVVIGLSWSDRPLTPCLEGPCPVPEAPRPPPPRPVCPGDPSCPPPPPPADRDQDGIPDDVDECPDEPEDKDGFEDQDGCPDPDNDKDGIPDISDKCPNEPETINGKDDDDGCPDKGEAEVHVGKEELETLRPIFFDTDRSRVRHAFYNILGQIALTLKAHPEIGRCAVEGHTDDTGPPEWNQKLSLLRADAVVEFLVGKGVDRKRLSSIGHGEKVPWESNETASGRAKNRRVIFHIEGANPEEELKLERRQQVRAHKAAVKSRSAPRSEGDGDGAAADSEEKGEEKAVKRAAHPPKTKPEPTGAAGDAKAADVKASDKASEKAAAKAPEKASDKPVEKTTPPAASPKPDQPPPTLHELLKLPPQRN
jgi:outer membrane protein OmpA-like peptidoglycan-associated protein